MTENNESTRILNDDELDYLLDKELGARTTDLLLVAANGSSGSQLPFKWNDARAYYNQYCASGNDCPDDEFPLDCTHFVCHGLSKTRVIVNLPEITCESGVCIRVAELAAAFKNSVDVYTNVTRIGSFEESREGDYLFIVSWFGLSKDHAMVAAGTISSNGGDVWGHTNSRCASHADWTGESIVIYRIE